MGNIHGTRLRIFGRESVKMNMIYRRMSYMFSLQSRVVHFEPNNHTGSEGSGGLNIPQRGPELDVKLKSIDYREAGENIYTDVKSSFCPAAAGLSAPFMT